MAFLSDRAFYISHHKPVDLETVFKPNGVNWRFTKSMQAMVWVPVNAMVYNRDVEGMDGYVVASAAARRGRGCNSWFVLSYESVLTSYHKLITIKTNRPLDINQEFMHRMARAVPEEKLAVRRRCASASHPRVHGVIPVLCQVAKEMHFSIQFALDMLFRPSQALKDQMLAFIESSRSAWDQPFTPCMHVRTGRADKRNSYVCTPAQRRLLCALVRQVGTRVAWVLTPRSGCVGWPS